MELTKRSEVFFRSSINPVKRVKAFTLVEILLVTILLAVAAGLSIPDLSRQYSNFQLSTTAKHISYLMRYAQSLAMIHQKEYRIHFSADRLSYGLEEEVGTEEGSVGVGSPEADKTFQRISGDKGRVFSIHQDILVETKNESLCFYPDGAMDRGEIVLRNKSQREIIISTKERRGQIDVLSPVS